MTAWITLLAGVAGAVIALAGQQWGTRRENKTRAGEILLEQCAQVIALSHDFRNRAWEEMVLGQQGKVDGWDVSGHRLAMARIQILCPNATVLQALKELQESGTSYGGHLRRRDVSEDKLKDLRQQNKDAIEDFREASARVVRKRLRAA